MTASCLSCSSGVSQEDYCAKNPSIEGCESKGGSKPCCRAATASCLACASGNSVNDYCSTNPCTEGCSSLGKKRARKFSRKCKKLCKGDPCTGGCPRRFAKACTK